MSFSKTFICNYFKYKRKFVTYLKNISRSHSVIKSTLADEPRKILFFGTDNFSLPSLKVLHRECNLDALGVVTSFKSPANCVRSYAEQHALSLHRWPIIAKVCQPYDLGVVVSFGQLIPAIIINEFPCGIINLHASLLPRWRGAAPIIYALMHDEATTGVSIMKIEPQHFDIGDILAQQEVPIAKNILMPELHSQLAIAGANLLVTTINNYSQYAANAIKQNNDNATYAPKITSTITDFDWAHLTAEELFNRYRALYGFKYLNTQFQGRQVQILETRLPVKEQIYEETLLDIPGSFIYQRENKSLLISCANGTQIELLKLRMEGRKAMTAQEFKNGFLKDHPHKSATELMFTKCINRIAC